MNPNYTGMNIYRHDSVIDSFDAQCLGEIHRLSERLKVALDLLEDCWEEFEHILRGGAKL